jgi:hypothetical protein
MKHTSKAAAAAACSALPGSRGAEPRATTLHGTVCLPAIRRRVRLLLALRARGHRLVDAEGGPASRLAGAPGRRTVVPARQSGPLRPTDATRTRHRTALAGSRTVRVDVPIGQAAAVVTSHALRADAMLRPQCADIFRCATKTGSLRPEGCDCIDCAGAPTCPDSSGLEQLGQSFGSATGSARRRSTRPMLFPLGPGKYGSTT